MSERQIFQKVLLNLNLNLVSTYCSEIQKETLLFSFNFPPILLCNAELSKQVQVQFLLFPDENSFLLPGPHCSHNCASVYSLLCYTRPYFTIFTFLIENILILFLFHYYTPSEKSGISYNRIFVQKSILYKKIVHIFSFTKHL